MANRNNNPGNNPNPNKPLTHHMDLNAQKAEIEQQQKYDAADISALAQAVSEMNAAYTAVASESKASTEEVRNMVGGILPAVQAGAKAIEELKADLGKFADPASARKHLVSDRSKPEQWRHAMNENKYIGGVNGAIGLVEDSPVGWAIKAGGTALVVKAGWELGKKLLGVDSDADMGDTPFEK